jgi:hypothetical protein
MAMWFSDMTQMPRLRDCLYELACNKLRRLRNLFGARGGGAPATATTVVRPRPPVQARSRDTTMTTAAGLSQDE